jgi:hypothetical protein
MNGLLKSTTSMRFWLMVSGAIAMSACRETISPTIPTIDEKNDFDSVPECLCVLPFRERSE